MTTSITEIAAPSGSAPARKPGKFRRLESYVGLGLIASVILACLVIPFVNGTDPNALVAPALQPPSPEHPFGTDAVGRDVFVRVFTAGRLDITLALLGVTIPLVVGTVIGTLVGASRSRAVDGIVMRLTDSVIAFPFVVLVLVVVLITGQDSSFPLLPAGSVSILAAVWISNWTFYARLARTRTHVLRGEDFIAAGRLLGFSQVRIVRRHLLPSVWPTTATYAVADVLFLISLIAALPFLGAGVQPPTPEWGSIMYEGRAYLSQAWWISLTTAGVVLVFGTGVMMVIDSLASNPRKAGLA
jgi:peptide/nickel transport system permease protein